MVSVNVYLTNTEHKKASSNEKHKEPDVEWRARIVNMSAFTLKPNFFKEFYTYNGRISVNIEGWSLYFTICVAMIFLALYLHLLSKASLICDMRGIAIANVLGASFLSFAAAESMATYFFDNIVDKLFNT